MESIYNFNSLNKTTKLSNMNHFISTTLFLKVSFLIYSGKLVPFEKQLLQLSLRSIFYVKKFIKKMKQCCLKSEEKVAWKVCYVGFNY